MIVTPLIDLDGVPIVFDTGKGRGSQENNLDKGATKVGMRTTATSSEWVGGTVRRILAIDISRLYVPGNISNC